MAVLSWGKPTILISELDDSGQASSWTEVPTPVEDSTQLSTTKGDKKEAKLEGGANQDVKYAKNTYALTFSIRAAKGVSKPIEDEDGLITANYAVKLIPEDSTIDGFMIQKAAVSVEDSWSSADGGMWTYTFEALQPKTGTQISWGVQTKS